MVGGKERYAVPDRNLGAVLTAVSKRVGSMRHTVLRTPWPVVLKPGLLILFASLVLAGGVLIASGRSRSTGLLEVTWDESVLAGSLALAGLVLHETGHAVAAHLAGRTVERLEFGMSGVAATSGTTTAARRALAIAAGPLVEIAAGTLLWSAGGSTWATPLGAAGLLALLNGAGNLLPVKPFDGRRLWTFIRLARRGNPVLKCYPSGPCPACTGTFPTADDREEALAA